MDGAPLAVRSPGWLTRLDAGLAAAERALIVVLCALMAGAVFLDAMHRTFSAEEGRLARLVAWLLPAALAGATRTVIAPVALLLATFGVTCAAWRTRDPGLGRSKVLLRGLVTTALLTAGTQALVRGLPNGLVWSQQMALCFMLWVGLLGASLGAREHSHIVFELAGKLWPARLRWQIDGLARFVAAGFCLFMALLALLYAREHYLEWATSDGQAGLFEALRVPRFLIFGFLPLPFASMGLRFIAHGFHAPAGATLGGLLPAVPAGPPDGEAPEKAPRDREEKA
jgi:TRAP-type C4-dicarboxylate transport system permease small subunit